MVRDPAQPAQATCIALTRARRQQALVLCLGLAVLALVALGGLVVSFLVTPEDIETGRVVLSPPCAARLLFGVDCPVCGLSRAFCAISHGELTRAMHYHALAPILYPLTWLGAGASAWGAGRSAARLVAPAGGNRP